MSTLSVYRSNCQAELTNCVRRWQKKHSILYIIKTDFYALLLYTGHGRILILTDDSVYSDFTGFPFDIMEYYSNECTDNGDLLLYMSDLHVTEFVLLIHSIILQYYSPVFSV